MISSTEDRTSFDPLATIHSPLKTVIERSQSELAVLTANTVKFGMITFLIH